jgi:ribosomal-protein-alanine acetyltransferase
MLGNVCYHCNSNLFATSTPEMTVELQTYYRSLQAGDADLLLAELPALLGGHWTAQALQADSPTGYQRRVLVLANTLELIAFAEFQNVVDECQLFNIAVLTKWQERGFGRQLLDAVLAEARHHKLQQCVLEVRESNSAARNLYQKAGFVAVGRRKDYYSALPGTGALANSREAAILYSLAL